MIVLEGREGQYQIRKISINSDRGLNIQTSQKTKFGIGKMTWNLDVISVTASVPGNTGRKES